MTDSTNISNKVMSYMSAEIVQQYLDMGPVAYLEHKTPPCWCTSDLVNYSSPRNADVDRITYQGRPIADIFDDLIMTIEDRYKTKLPKSYVLVAVHLSNYNSCHSFGPKKTEKYGPISMCCLFSTPQSEKDSFRVDVAIKDGQITKTYLIKFAPCSIVEWLRKDMHWTGKVLWCGGSRGSGRMFGTD